MTTRHLHLLRHAKASWDLADQADHERPLAPRGRRACAALADHISTSRIAPDLVLCSSALRTRQTLEAIRDALPHDAEVEVEDALYSATTSSLLQRLQGLSDRVTAVMVIGHNPGIGELAATLAGSGDATAREKLRAGYPTGALATLAVSGSWSELTAGAASLESLVVPRELG